MSLTGPCVCANDCVRDTCSSSNPQTSQLSPLPFPVFSPPFPFPPSSPSLPLLSPPSLLYSPPIPPPPFSLLPLPAPPLPPPPSPSPLSPPQLWLCHFDVLFCPHCGPSPGGRSGMCRSQPPQEGAALEQGQALSLHSHHSAHVRSCDVM